MTQYVRDIMTEDLETVPAETPLTEVACVMRVKDIGDVLVAGDDGRVCGIVTDRDIVVRAAARGRDLDRTTAGEICSMGLVHVAPTATIQDAAHLMRQRSVRRIAVVSDGRPVGIVSLGDLAKVVDPGSVLGQISDSPASH